MTANSLGKLPDVILAKIHEIDGAKVMLDSDLAELYQVPTKRLNEQVKRNSARFPLDFMFQLNREQWNLLKSHSATSSWGGRRTLPFVFTEQGVSMRSSVLRDSGNLSGLEKKYGMEL